jgi:hypothetical protein
MSRRLAARLGAVLVPAALLPPAAAHAERIVTTDPAADVVSIGPTEQGGDDLDNLVPAPDNLTADVVRTVVDHDEARLRVRIDLRELGRSRRYFAVLRVRTPAGTFEVETDNLGRRPKVEMTRGSRAVECPRLRAVGDHAAARAVITVPTSCLGSPRWVEVGAGVASVETVMTAEGTEQVLVFADDAHRAGEIRDRIALGPKVRRG